MKHKIIDAHVHITDFSHLTDNARRFLESNPHFSQRIATYTSSPDSLLRIMDEVGIERLVMVNYVSKLIGFPEKVNDWAASFARGHKDRLIPIGSIEPKSIDPNEAKKKLERLFYDLEIRGLKLHPAHQLFYPNEYLRGLESLRTIYEVAEDAGVPILIHTGTSMFPGARNVYCDPLYIDDVAVDYPKLKIVVAHAGRPLWMQTAFFLVRRHDNVFVDISGIPPKRLLQYFPRLPDVADKVLYGSDWPSPPATSIETNAEQIISLEIDHDLKRKLLFENARRIYSPP